MVKPAAMPVQRARFAPGAVGWVLWGLVPIVTLGIGAAVPFIRISLVTRRWRDIAVAVLYGTGSMVLMLSPESDQPNGSTAMDLLVLVLIPVATGHALWALHQLRQGWALAGSPNHQVVREAQQRQLRRAEARRLLLTQPDVAHDLRIGRPDLPRRFDDGGLVDVNTVPADVLMACLGWSRAEADSVIRARVRLGRFSGPQELIAFGDLPPTRADEASQFLTYGRTRAASEVIANEVADGHATTVTPGSDDRP